MPMLRRPGQPLDALLFVTLDHLPLEQQLSQEILRMRISGLGGGIDVIHGLAGIPSYRFTLQIFLAQTVGGVGVSVLNCSLQPLDALGSVMDHRIVREL